MRVTLMKGAHNFVNDSCAIEVSNHNETRSLFQSNSVVLNSTK